MPGSSVPPSWRGTAIPRETPRRIRLPASAWIGRLFVVGLILFFEALIVRLAVKELPRGPRGWGPCAFVQAIFFAVGAPIAWRRTRLRTLVVSGDVATAIVLARFDTRIRLQRGGSVPSVTLTYAFADASGRRFEGRCAVTATSLVAGSTVPVFYDRERPERSVPMAAVPYEILPTSV